MYCSLAGPYDNTIPNRFLAPIDCLKILARIPLLQKMATFFKGRDCDGMPEEGEEKNSCAEQDQAPIADITAGQAQQSKHH